MIREVIIVEGKDDITAVKHAVDAEVVVFHRFSARQKGVLRLGHRTADARTDRLARIIGIS